MSEPLIVAELGIIGLAVGSFVNALAWRLHESRDWIRERSECPHCHHVLVPKDLIPIVSFVWLRGKCRYCRKPIDDTPLPEILLPVLFIASYLWWPTSLNGLGLFDFICWLILLVTFMALVVYDLRWMLLPNAIVIPTIGLAVAETLVRPLFYSTSWHEAFGAFLGGILLYGLFYGLFFISDGTWIGGGDVKLVIVLGILAGDPLRAFLVLFFASISGLLAAIPQIIVHKTRALKLKLPFGPFLILGLVIVQLFGTDIVDWYMRLLGR